MQIPDARDLQQSAEAAARALEALTSASAALRENRRQFASLLESLSGVFYRCTLKAPWTFDYVSKSVTALTGYRAEHFEQGGCWSEIMHPDDVAFVAEAVDEAVAAERCFAMSYRIRHRDGSERWVHERGQAIYEDGRPIFLEGIISDISAQKALELSLTEAVTAQQQLAERWRSVLDIIPQLVWTVGADGEIYYNQRWRDFTGETTDPDQARRLALIHPEDQERVAVSWHASLASGEDYACEYRLRHHDGEFRWVLSRGQADRDEAGNIRGWYGTCSDVHDLVLARQALEESDLRARRILDSVPQIIWCADASGHIDYVSPQWAEGFGAMPGEVGDEGWIAMLHGDDRLAAIDSWRRCVKAGAHYETRFRIRKADGSHGWALVRARPERGEDGRITRWFGTCTDIHQQVMAEEQARWAANHDALTGLPNRLLLQERLDEEIAHAIGHTGARGGGGFALLLLDIDHFKRLNDTIGHDAGDRLLETFAARLRAAAGDAGTVARLGGDEFAVILDGVADERALDKAVAGILATLREPCVLGGRMVDCQASVGAALFPRDGRSRVELMNNADVALYAAKRAGRGTCRRFQPDMRNAFQRRAAMLNLARDAVGNDWIRPHYQPAIDFATGRVVGFEALLRWRDPRRGIQLPETIEAAFEEPGLGVEISDRMIDRTIADLRAWLDQGVDFGNVSINAAAAELRRGDFAERLLARLDEAKVPTSSIWLEVTETVFLGRGAEFVERALKTLSAAGVKIALDDFGTGYASLSHLKQFPVDYIKIDRSFVRDLLVDPGDAAIVDAVIRLGHSLGIGIVAEGIETIEQHRMLAELGCTQGQGFLYGKAIPAARVPALLRAGVATTARQKRAA